MRKPNLAFSFIVLAIVLIVLLVIAAIGGIRAIIFPLGVVLIVIAIIALILKYTVEPIQLTGALYWRFFWIALLVGAALVLYAAHGTKLFVSSGKPTQNQAPLEYGRRESVVKVFDAGRVAELWWNGHSESEGTPLKGYRIDNQMDLRGSTKLLIEYKCASDDNGCITESAVPRFAYRSNCISYPRQGTGYYCFGPGGQDGTVGLDYRNTHRFVSNSHFGSHVTCVVQGKRPNGFLPRTLVQDFNDTRVQCFAWGQKELVVKLTGGTPVTLYYNYDFKWIEDIGTDGSRIHLLIAVLR